MKTHEDGVRPPSTDGWIAVYVESASGTAGFIVDFWEQKHRKVAQAWHKRLGLGPWQGDFYDNKGHVLENFSRFWDKAQLARFDLNHEVVFMMPEEQARALIGYDAGTELPALTRHTKKALKLVPEPFHRLDKEDDEDE